MLILFSIYNLIFLPFLSPLLPSFICTLLSSIRIENQGKMSSLSMVEAKLPPGFRFHPRDDELVCDYLIKKWNGSESALLIEVDLNKCEPWDIPETASVGGKECYFYSQRDKKYATGLRTNRATVSGYWKATGKDRPIARKGSLVGMRKTLVFYQGRAPKGKKTDWVMHEFRVEGPFGPPKTSTSKEDWVLCRVFYKNRDHQVPSKSCDMGRIHDSHCYDDETGSSSLPPLMDPYISFDQTQPNYQQVPCFSMYSPNQTNRSTNNNQHPTLLAHVYQLDSNTTTKNNNDHTTLGGAMMPDNINSTLNNTLSCDKKVLEAVLCHLTKMECSATIKESPSLGDQPASSESYLSEVALPPNMWTHY